MKTILSLLIVVFICFSQLYSQTYYISNDGDDMNDGLSDGNAWASVDEALNNVDDGDTILLRRGDIFRETVNFTIDTLENLYISNYGNASDTLPIISGSIEIIGWTLWQDGIYEATVTQNIEEVFANNEYMTLARYPNSGWLRVSEVGSGYITSPELADNPNDANDYYNGGDVRIRAWSWYFHTNPISDYQAGGRITSTANSDYKDEGFYIDGILEELDTVGEWYYDGGANKVYFKPPSGVDPNTMLMEGSIRDEGIHIHASTIDGVWFRHQTDFGVHIKDNSKVMNSVFTGIGSDAGGRSLFASWDVVTAEILNNHFEDNLNNSIYWNVSSSNGFSLIENNTFINSGTFPAKGGEGSWHACAIIIGNGLARVQYNYIDHVGYVGILLGSDGNYAEHNIIKRAMSTLNDGGAIYTNSNRSYIKHNIILDTEGDLESSKAWANLGHGIWPEFLSNFRESEIENNIVAGSGGFGIFLPNNFDCLVRNNICYNNTRASIDLSGRNDNPTPQNHLIDSNVFFGAIPGQMTVRYGQGYDYGTLNANYICNPFSHNTIDAISARNPEWFKANVSFGDKNFKTDLYKVPEYRSWNHGGQMVINSEFNAQEIPWEKHALSNDINLEIDPSGKISGNSLKIEHGYGNGMIQYANEIAFESGQFYELTLDYVFDKLFQSNSSNSEQEFQIWVYDNASDEAIGVYTLSVSEAIKKAWFVFQPAASTTQGSIWINIEADEMNNLYIDNIRLSTVDAAAKEPLDESQLIYNDSRATKSFSIGSGEWHDLDGNEITGSVTLEPFTGIVLVRGETGQFPGSLPDFENNPLPDNINNNLVNMPYSIYPNPCNGKFTLNNIENVNNISIYDISGKKVTAIHNTSNANKLDISGMSSGVYFVQINDINNSKVLQVVVE